MTRPENVAEIAGRVEWLYTPSLRGSVEERFWQAVERAGEDECWQWLLAPTSRGYGRMQTPLGSSTPAHRISVLLHGRTIPPDHVVDHICRNRMCVNPSHLRIVTPKINSLENSNSLGAINARKTHCYRGHEYTPENTRMKGTWRVCISCRRIDGLAYRQKCNHLRATGAAE